jgi:hypothetical protein
MRWIFNIAIFCVVLACSLTAQMSQKSGQSDTSVIVMNRLNDDFSGVHLPEMFQPSLRFAPVYRPSLLQPSFPYAMQPFSLKLPEKIDLTSPWNCELTDRNKMRTVYMILGSVQTGAVAYMAYRQLKKHGLK